ncbi:MAG: glycosyltransferase family 2 protein [Sphingorhabdus sp.]
MEHIPLKLFSVDEAKPLEFAVIVPVLNERDNVGPLLQDISIALAGIEWEVVFVDDGSTDGTIELLESLALRDQRVRLVRRIGRRGLSSAVIEGFLATVAPIVSVIDGDRQHDERLLPEMFHAIAAKDFQMAIGTRYAGGGSVGQWDSARVRISKFATSLAGLVMKTPLSDPMSGFFAVRRETFIGLVPQLSKMGYKILLDVVASSKTPLRVVELPYEFRTRTAGESKLDNMVALEYVELLLDKIIGKYIPVKLLMFGTIGVMGAVIHLTLLSMLLNVSGVAFATSQALATFGAMIFNFTLNNEFTHRDRKLRGPKWVTGLVSFCLACGFGAVANVGLGSLLFAQSWSWWAAGLAGAAIGSVWNYVATSWLTWRKR